jgi:uncharacterized C2H2 Zn-finger protein
MSSEEILEVKKIGRIDGEWGCKCPHCGNIITFTEEDIDDVRGSQYQCSRPLSIRTMELCNGWLEVSDEAGYTRNLFEGNN